MVTYQWTIEAALAWIATLDVAVCDKLHLSFETGYNAIAKALGDTTYHSPLTYLNSDEAKALTRALVAGKIAAYGIFSHEQPVYGYRISEPAPLSPDDRKKLMSLGRPSQFGDGYRQQMPQRPIPPEDWKELTLRESGAEIVAEGASYLGYWKQISVAVDGLYRVWPGVTPKAQPVDQKSKALKDEKLAAKVRDAALELMKKGVRPSPTLIARQLEQRFPTLLFTSIVRYISPVVLEFRGSTRRKPQQKIRKKQAN